MTEGWRDGVTEGCRRYLPFVESLVASAPPSVLLQGSSSSSLHHPSICSSCILARLRRRTKGTKCTTRAPPLDGHQNISSHLDVMFLITSRCGGGISERQPSAFNSAQVLLNTLKYCKARQSVVIRQLRGGVGGGGV